MKNIIAKVIVLKKQINMTSIIDEEYYYTTFVLNIIAKYSSFLCRDIYSVFAFDLYFMYVFILSSIITVFVPWLS